jgi:hypothetical protein
MMTVRAFARQMLREDRLRLSPLKGSLRAFGSTAFESVMFRDGIWQVEMIHLLPNASIARHRHNRCDSIDLLLCGEGTAEIDGRPVPGIRTDASLAASLVPVPRGQWHGGGAGEHGCVYLSFQKWTGAADYISSDWEAWSPEPK